MKKKKKRTKKNFSKNKKKLKNSFLISVNDIFVMNLVYIT